jgi:hypothetical protein
MKDGTVEVYYLLNNGTLTMVEPSVEFIHNLGTRAYSTGDAYGNRYDSPETVSFFLGSPEQWDVEFKTNPDYQPK